MKRELLLWEKESTNWIFAVLILVSMFLALDAMKHGVYNFFATFILLIDIIVGLIISVNVGKEYEYKTFRARIMSDSLQRLFSRKEIISIICIGVVAVLQFICLSFESLNISQLLICEFALVISLLIHMEFCFIAVVITKKIIGGCIIAVVMYIAENYLMFLDFLPQNMSLAIVRDWLFFDRLLLGRALLLVLLYGVLVIIRKVIIKYTQFT